MTTPFQPLPCPGGGAGATAADVEQLLLCDVLPDGTIVGTALAVYEYDSDGNPVGPPTFVDPVTGAPYVPQGTLMACPEGSVSEFILCDVQPDNSAVQFVRKLIQGPNGDVRNVVDLTLDGAAYAPTGTVATCDPSAICIPDPGQNLDGGCLVPGEPVNQAITNQNADITDDPAADELCGGGTWGTSPIAQPPPFPIEEPSRSSTFADPDVQVHGDAHLTGGVEDADGFGWLRLVDNNFNNGPSGAVIFNTAFPSSEDVVLFFDYAMFDPGIATQGLGDGFTFFLLDGTGPVPSYPAGTGSGGGMGYSCNLGAGQPGIQDGYIGVGFDLFGNFADPSHGTGGPGRTPNSITVRGSGDGALCGTGAYPHILTKPVSPNLIGPHPRTNPVSVRATLRNDGASTFLTVDVDWKDGAGYVTEINRLDITAAAGPLPAQLRLGFAGATGGALANMDLRDIRTLAGGEQSWRALPVTTTDPVPACATQLRVTADVDVTFTSDSQDPGAIDPDPEARLWLVNSVTNTVLDTDEVGSLPSQVGDVHHLDVGATITPADLPNIRVYVGADQRDAAGSYGSVWENLDVGVVALGCPATRVRTVPVSAPCPIDVRVIGGDSDGTPTPVTVVNTPPTVAFAPICAVVDGAQVSAFRHEVRDADGNITVQFLGVDGTVIAPSTWVPGSCISDTELVPLCDFLPGGGVVPFVQRLTFDAAGEVISFENIGAGGATYTPTGSVGACDGGSVTAELLCDANGDRFIRRYSWSSNSPVPTIADYTLAGAPFVPVGAVGPCAASDGDGERVTLGPTCYINPNPPGEARSGFLVVDGDGTAHIFDLAGVEVTPFPLIVICAENAFFEEILCDQGNAGHQFIRRYVGSAITGLNDSTGDWELDGATAYVPVGPVAICAADPCTSCQTLTLCDFGADEPALITGLTNGGTLSNGVTWAGARGSNSNRNAQYTNADGSWWRLAVFPNATVAPDTWFFDRPVDVEFSVVIAYSGATGAGAINQVQVPIGSELISSASDYGYDVATGIVTVDSSNSGDCTKLSDPTVAKSARFVLRNVTQFTLAFLGQRIAICGQFGNWRFGSIAVTPATTTFLRTICRDCDGAITTVTDTEPDGTTPYTPIEPVGECGTHADAEPQCFATQICVQPQGVQEFISNEANLTSTVAVPNVDPVWKWSNDPVAGPWFNMYDVGVFPGWTTVDPGTTQGVANWVAPHPNSSPNTSGLPGEGPTIGPGNAQWYARAQFTLPANADPASIKIAATVLNADQLGVEFRLNNGAWQPVNASHIDPPFNFPAQVIPGAQAGLNEVFVHITETVFGSGAAGVKMHLIASYDLGDQQSWTQIVCDDGSVSYFTNAGEQTDALPDDWAVVPCGAASSAGDTVCCPTVLSEGCTNVGSGFYTALRLADGTISLIDSVTGAAVLAANIVACAPAGGALPTSIAADHFDVVPGTPYTPAVLPAGRRLVGLSYVVVSGTVTTVDATGATSIAGIPAGYSTDWNVEDDRETLSGPASITAAAASRAIVTFVTAAP